MTIRLNKFTHGRRAIVAALLLIGVIISTLSAQAQFWGGRRGGRAPDPPALKDFPGGKFTFCTIRFSNNGWNEPLGFGWNTDYPDSGFNFMIRLAELTTIEINKEDNGDPRQEVLRLTDPTLFNYPFIFMSDVGTAGFSKEEADNLREYLLRGGFLLADDFWGDRAWDNWVYEMEQIFPPDEYKIRDIPLTHDIFHIVFNVTEVPQVPSIQYWSQTRNGTTSERGMESAEPHLRGIWDKNGRLMVVMSHNTDIADGWEKERENEEYFREFSVKKSYPIGINIVVYALTH